MCGRFNLISSPLTQFVMSIVEGDISVDLLHTQRQNDPSILSIYLETRYNLAPTDQVPVLLRTTEGTWDIRDMRWWLVPHWSKGPDSKYTMFNAKSETLTTSRAYKQPFKFRRCIVPASGYYEWVKEAGGKQPYYIEPVNAEGLCFAAIWETWKGQNSVIESCSIVTTAATEGLASLHHRVPVMLSLEEVNAWVNPESDADILTRILTPSHKFPLSITPVTTYVNNARHKDQGCLETVGDPVIVN